MKVKTLLKATALAVLLSIEVNAGEAPAPEQPAPQKTIQQMTIEELTKLEGRVEAVRDIMMNQAANEANANLKAIAEEKAKRGAKPEAKATK